MYGIRRNSKGKYLEESLLKEVKEIVINKEGKNVEQVKYKIILKNRTTYYDVETLSRGYANRFKNGDELSRDGYKFSGKGIKQLTWKDNYEAFTNQRLGMNFPDDNSGKIDFTLTTNTSTLAGNYDKLADKDNVMFGVQAAIWYWVKRKSVYKQADNDDVFLASIQINGGLNGFDSGDYPRKGGIIKARKAFKVYEHYKLIYENGKSSDRSKVRKNLILIGNTKKRSKKVVKTTYSATVEKDPKAEELLKEIKESEVLKPVETKPFIPLVVKEDLTLAPMNFKTPTNTESNKKKRKQR